MPNNITRHARITAIAFSLSAVTPLLAACSSSPNADGLDERGNRSPSAVPATPTVDPAAGSRLSIGDHPYTLRLTRSTRLGEGVYFHELVEPSGPNQIRLIELDTETADLDLVPAGSNYPQLASVGTMVQRADALAGVNGEFYTLPGRPEFLSMADGELWQTGLHKANTVAVTNGDDSVDVRSVNVRITASPIAGDRALTIRNWNTYPPAGRSISAYTSRGGSVAVPPSSACAVRLAHPSAPRWIRGQRGIERVYTVAQTGCGGVRRPAGTEVVLAADGSARSELAGIRRGQRIRIEVATDVPGMLDLAGGQPVLVKDGKNVAGGRCTTSFCTKQPRTGLGMRSDGLALVMTVDGLQEHWSVGMTPSDWADLFVQVGAADAINLDGGASTQMVVKGLGLVDRPSTPNGKQRHVGTALVVLPGEDAGVPPTLRSEPGPP
ncbi:MAG: phosphodiester glycosidase family protein [Actinomycetota bacterium]